MRERNLYLQKCRQIEELGEKLEWGGENSFDDEEEEFNRPLSDDQQLLQEVYEILYTEK